MWQHILAKNFLIFSGRTRVERESRIEEKVVEKLNVLEALLHVILWTTSFNCFFSSCEFVSIYRWLEYYS